MLLGAGSSILGIYAYDRYACSKLHAAAIERAKKYGARPLGGIDPSSRTLIPKVRVFYTVRSSFLKFSTNEFFQRYANTYLSLAGVDVEESGWNLKKLLTTETPRAPPYSVEHADEVLNAKHPANIYASEVAYKEALEPRLSRDVADDVFDANSPVTLCCLNWEDSKCVAKQHVLIPCAEDPSFIGRVARSFVRRHQLRRVIDETFSVIDAVTR